MRIFVTHTAAVVAVLRFLAPSLNLLTTISCSVYQKITAGYETLRN